MRFTAFLIAMLVGISYSTAVADDPSFEETRTKAEQGEAKAQVNLGKMYFNGCGGAPQDCTKATPWYRKAADQGVAHAQRMLGFLYSTGIDGCGVSQDYAEALKWIRKAAEQGYDEIGRASCRERV